MELGFCFTDPQIKINDLSPFQKRLAILIGMSQNLTSRSLFLLENLSSGLTSENLNTVLLYLKSLTKLKAAILIFDDSKYIETFSDCCVNLNHSN